MKKKKNRSPRALHCFVFKMSLCLFCLFVCFTRNVMLKDAGADAGTWELGDAHILTCFSFFVFFLRRNVSNVYCVTLLFKTNHILTVTHSTV